MKVTDLMVGDWVYTHEPEGSIIPEGKAHRIQEIWGISDEVTADDSWYPIEDVRPIPLTEDILVKNGFEKRYFDYDFSYDLYEDDNVSFVRLYDHGEGVFFTETSGGDIMIKYVHQLQHLLRTVGVDKEIEL